MPYIGGALADLYDEAPTRRALVKMADRGTDRLAELIELHTPVDTGNLKGSWKKTPLVIKPGFHTRYERRVFTEVEYAPYVEHGTGLWGPKHAKYLIVPKKPGGVLHWIGPGGESVFATRVWHPGSPGAHMVVKGVADVEAAFALILDPVLHEWAREMELLG